MGHGRHRFNTDHRDENEPEIILEFEDAGAWVVKLSTPKKDGVPDLLVGYNGKWALVEVKRDEKAPLSPEQLIFASECLSRDLLWFRADCIDDAPYILGVMG